MVHVAAETIDESTGKDFRTARPGPGEVLLWWLGQAGFAFRCGHVFGMIDPYLSDHLAAKYRGTDKPHDRLMPGPVKADDVRGLDVVLCSHAHSDHMDPEALSILARNNPECCFLVPAAEMARAAEVGVPEDRLRPVNAGDTVPVGETQIDVLASAHEDCRTDENGMHHFLGFVLRFGSLTLYHSGDCVPYPGLGEALKDVSIDMALLPVNGRDDRRNALGIVGNFTFEEAVGLCREAGVRVLMAHHFGLFAINTIERTDLEARVTQLQNGFRGLLPDTDVRYRVTQGGPS
jgi:L-ascorbate metabolism protein UlaG (beta-lactamase superfamily)